MEAKINLTKPEIESSCVRADQVCELKVEPTDCEPRGVLRGWLQGPVWNDLEARLKCIVWMQPEARLSIIEKSRACLREIILFEISGPQNVRDEISKELDALGRDDEE